MSNNSSNNTMAVIALICGIVAWCGGSLLTAIPGLILGKIELNKIAAGESAPSNKTMAQIGFWLSLAHVILTVGGALFLCVFQVLFFAGIVGFSALGAMLSALG